MVGVVKWQWLSEGVAWDRWSFFGSDSRGRGRMRRMDSVPAQE